LYLFYFYSLKKTDENLFPDCFITMQLLFFCTATIAAQKPVKKAVVKKPVAKTTPAKKTAPKPVTQVPAPGDRIFQWY
jgi:hypothetical protein